MRKEANIIRTASVWELEKMGKESLEQESGKEFDEAEQEGGKRTKKVIKAQRKMQIKVAAVRNMYTIFSKFDP
jgi:hypothetical protein